MTAWSDAEGPLSAVQHPVHPAQGGLRGAQQRHALGQHAVSRRPDLMLREHRGGCSTLAKVALGVRRLIRSVLDDAHLIGEALQVEQGVGRQAVLQHVGQPSLHSAHQSIQNTAVCDRVTTATAAKSQPCLGRI